MNIRNHIEAFAKKNHRYRPYSKIYKQLLTGGKPYSLNSQPGFEESEYLPVTIRDSVQAYSSNKDTAIALYRDLVRFLEEQGVAVPAVEFPPVPVSNTFERLLYIAKYLQEPEHRISDLPERLWVSARTIEEDVGRLRGLEDPIQVCGRKFFIPDTVRQDGRVGFPSTAHPLFLAENLTQILVMLKGLKAMSEDPLYRPYALQTGKEIWGQLSPYAKDRIRFVLGSLLPEDLEWYESLSGPEEENSFHTEEACGRVSNRGDGILLDCLKNGKSFCAEYEEEDGTVRLYRDCLIENGSCRSDPFRITVNGPGGRKELVLDRVIRSALTAEELACN